jgi:hypothetical protein
MNATLIIAGTVLAVTLILAAAGLKAWRGWLDLRRLELASRTGAEAGAKTDVGVRIELAAVRERLKKLEAIASGVEL